MIVVTELVKTCNACPAQWQGRTHDGRWLYVRYRWGGLRVGLGDTLEDAIDDDTFYANVGGAFDGVMTFEELKQHTSGLLTFADNVETD